VSSDVRERAGQWVTAVQADPSRISSLRDLAGEFDKLRMRAARPGQVRLSVRDVAARIGKAPSTIDPYLAGRRLCPADTYEEILRALGVANDEIRPWLEAWERIADGRVAPAVGFSPRRGHALSYGDVFRYALVGPGADRALCLGIVTGDLRRVRGVDVWVNPENTDMSMARFDEHSVSAIVRYEGAVRDDGGRVVADTVAEDLVRRTRERIPVAAGTAITTTAGELTARNGVRYLVHVAAVHGEPGEGYRQVADVARCATNALAEAHRLGGDDAPVRSVLLPLLGAGTGGGALEPTVTALLGACLDHLAATRPIRVHTVYFLAYTDAELDVCRAVFDAHARLRPVGAAAAQLGSSGVDAGSHRTP